MSRALYRFPSLSTATLLQSTGKLKDQCIYQCIFRHRDTRFRDYEPGKDTWEPGGAKATVSRQITLIETPREPLLKANAVLQAYLSERRKLYVRAFFTKIQDRTKAPTLLRLATQSEDLHDDRNFQTFDLICSWVVADFTPVMIWEFPSMAVMCIHMLCSLL
jgi:hypothetical protein